MNPDFSDLLATGAFLLSVLVAIVQTIKMVRDAQLAAKKQPAETKVDESQYAKNAIDIANLNTEVRLKLEAKNLELSDKVERLDTEMKGLEHKIQLLTKKNAKLVKAVNDLNDGIIILLKQLRKMNIEPEWVPAVIIQELIKG